MFKFECKTMNFHKKILAKRQRFRALTTEMLILQLFDIYPLKPLVKVRTPKINTDRVGRVTIVDLSPARLVWIKCEYR